jgi:hypothetical protein
MQNFDHDIGFWEKRQFSKIAENCDHNIDPWKKHFFFFSSFVDRRESRDDAGPSVKVRTLRQAPDHEKHKMTFHKGLFTQI